jgi:hypothetical protein
MEYEFTNDPITGKASAKFSLEHENIGSWLEIELAKNVDKLTELLTAIASVEKGEQHEVLINGSEFSVLIEKHDVTIAHHSLHDAPDEQLAAMADELHNDQFNALSQCGLEDFHQLLLSWSKFIN